MKLSQNESQSQRKIIKQQLDRNDALMNTLMLYFLLSAQAKD